MQLHDNVWIVIFESLFLFALIIVFFVKLAKMLHK